MKNDSAARKDEQTVPAMQIVKPVLAITEKTEVVKPVDTPQKKVPTLQDLKNRATVVYLLQEKHTKLSEKRASLDTFTIKHDKENAVITVKDAGGEEFKSSSPKTIANLIEFWKKEFNEAISEVEAELIKTFAA